MDTKAVVARFESERQALALMEHPSIAKVFDAGVTPSGRPYFVMEYVPGIPITDYCDKHQLTFKARLALFLEVCQAVQHAHLKAVIHRDLKPSNVLVEEVDDKAVPKIIDFGLAKAMGQRLTEMTMLTEVGAILGTPAYMSPEQADRDEPSIDTRTDVYSLGVMLYELLVGTLPFGSELAQPGQEAMLKKIREQDAPRPSTKVKTLGESSKEAAVKRGEEPRSLEQQLRGELDWITMKAIEKDRSRRYASPAELAADIERYLHHEPVLAGPPTAVYRARKFVRRHRFGVGVAMVAVVLLVTFALTMALEARRIAKERDRANREAETSKGVSEFMTNMFKVSDPGEARGNTITAREILDKASKQIRNDLSRDPLVQTQLMHVMGGVYYNLGLYPQAQSLFADAAEVRRRILGRENPDTLASLKALCGALRAQGRYREAEQLQRETLDVQRRVLGPEHADTLASASQLAFILYEEARYSEAEKLGREALDVQRRVLGTDNPATQWSMATVASIYYDEGRFPEAERLYREALDIRLRLLGRDHPDTLALADGLATTLAQEHRNAEAEQLLRATLDSRQRVLGPEHRDTLMSMNNLANMLFIEGRYAEAEKIQRTAFDIQFRVLGPDNPDTAMSTYNLGGIALRKGQRDKALALLGRAVDHGLAPHIALYLEKDPDFASLHGDPRFIALVAHAKERAAAAQKSQ